MPIPHHSNFNLTGSWLHFVQRLDHAYISFSGGRTSAYMLYRILLAKEGKLPENVIVLFANTGKEHPATLDFVQQVGREWEVDIRWIEYNPDKPSKPRQVSHNSASRSGEPFAGLIANMGMLPNPMMRACTSRLKIMPMERYARKILGKGFSSILGIRADEPRRVHNIQKRVDNNALLPLYEAGIDAGEVLDFWRTYSQMEGGFDLELPVVGGETVGGNCDLCFLKGVRKITQLIALNPESADWWIEQERSIPERLRKTSVGHSVFRMNRPYSHLKAKGLRMRQQAQAQPSMLSADGDKEYDLIPAFEVVNAGERGRAKVSKFEAMQSAPEAPDAEQQADPYQPDLDELGDCFCGD